MISPGFAAAVALSTLQLAAQRQPPADLTARLDKARVEGTLVSWCQAQFESGRQHAYAVAMTAPTGGGRYLVVDHEGKAVELARFNNAPDLACYTRAEARKLNEAIRASDTISGGIAPLFPTTIVCAFVENTEAVCWQYAPRSRSFVTVGQWHT